MPTEYLVMYSVTYKQIVGEGKCHSVIDNVESNIVQASIIIS